MDNNYTVLHLHSDFSNGTTNIDSVTKFDKYIERAKELNMKALAYSEHGNCFSWEKKMAMCKDNGLKYIHGVELYVTETLEEKKRDNYHMCLYAINTDGLYEINRLLSIASNRKDNHFYFVPRITFEELKGISKNIIIATACLGGLLNKAHQDLRDEFIKYLIENKDRCYLEIQHHEVSAQRLYNEYLYKLHLETGIPLTIGTDTHALNKKHLKGRKILQQSKKIFFDDEEGWDLSFKTYNELIDIYSRYHINIPIDKIKEALENTNNIANRIEDYNIDFSVKYPKLYENSEKVFQQKILDGIKKRNIDKKPNFNEYMKRINEEWKVYKQLGAIDYMLLETKILEDAKLNGIEYGYGRGSVNGSIIAYLLGITECDSVKFNLNFFRFLNPDRASMADIDIDFCRKDRDWVKEYLFNMKGVYCSEIITFNTIADKGAIRDVARAFKDDDNYETLSQDEVSYICNNLETEGEKFREQHKELFEIVDIIKGTIVSLGTHPSGVIVSPIPLNDSVGLCSLSTTNHPVSMIQMKEIDTLKFVKLDILGLDNIGLINETCKMIGIDRYTPDTIDFDDENVYKSLLEDTTTIFQMESDMAKAYLRKILKEDTFKKIKERYPNIKKFDILKFTNGAIRPSGESFRNEASEGICGNNGLKELDDMLYDTLGYCLLQEQIMMFLVKFCGYSMAESDLVRRAIAKKGGTEQFIPEIESRFIEYTTNNFGITKDKAEEIIVKFTQIIIDAQNYGFSDNHNFPYTTTAYICAYLRYYYPIEYLSTALNMWSDDDEKTTKITEYANKRGITINPPKFRYSKFNYFPSKKTNSIYKGISSIKFCNEQIGKELYELRDNKYDTFLDLLIELQNTSINSRQLEILIKLNYFDEFGKTKYLLKIVDLYNKIYTKKQFKKATLSEENQSLIRSYAKNETEKMFTKVDTESLVKEVISKLPNESLPIKELMISEIEYLGYISYIDKSYPNDISIVTEIKINTWGTPFLTLYQLATGKSITIKANKKYYENKPLNQFDMIKIVDISSKNKKRKDKETGKWIQLEEKENILESYSIIIE